MLTIYELKLEVSSPCQNDCELCAHADLMRHVKGFQLSLDQLDRFLFFTEKSDYFIRSLSLHGPGEPFLWRHLNEGLMRLKKSHAIGWITMVTNGLLLDRISDDAMGCLDKLFVSVYSNFNNHAVLSTFQQRFGKKIALWDGTFFWEHSSDKQHTVPATGGCNCFGPMVYNDQVFPYCGPPVFGAAKSKGVDVMQEPNLSVPISMNYMDSFNMQLMGRMDICRYCWANPNFDGKWKANDPRKKLVGTPHNAINLVMPHAGQTRADVSPAIR